MSDIEATTRIGKMNGPETTRKMSWSGSLQEYTQIQGNAYGSIHEPTGFSDI